MATTISALYRKLGFAGNAGIWKVLALIFALVNLKSLPLVWHLRLLKGLFTHLRTSRYRLAHAPGPGTLFQPLITTSRSGWLECDYNLHKSNATYFSDFDVGRLELLVALCTRGMEETGRELAREEKEGAVGGGRFEIRLGGVSCQFRKEIRPYEKFEVWTRVLCWDRKWMYVICHFVKPGVVRPGRYVLQPWRGGGRRQGDQTASGGGAIGNNNADGNATPAPHPAIFASGIAKYVCKKGRLTIPPERVLRASNLLPPQPSGYVTPPATATPTPESTSNSAAAVAMADGITPGNAEDVVGASLRANVGHEEGEWTWEKVEEERKRGMRIAEMWGALEGLNGEFAGDGAVALGRY